MNIKSKIRKMNKNKFGSFCEIVGTHALSTVGAIRKNGADGDIVIPGEELVRDSKGTRVHLNKNEKCPTNGKLHHSGEQHECREIRLNVIPYTDKWSVHYDNQLVRTYTWDEISVIFLSWLSKTKKVINNNTQYIEKVERLSRVESREQAEQREKVALQALIEKNGGNNDYTSICKMWNSWSGKEKTDFIFKYKLSSFFGPYYFTKRTQMYNDGRNQYGLVVAWKYGFLPTIELVTRMLKCSLKNVFKLGVKYHEPMVKAFVEELNCIDNVDRINKELRHNGSKYIFVEVNKG